MGRRLFGGEWATTDAAGNITPSDQGRVYTARSAGAQVVDLMDAAGISNLAGGIVVSDQFGGFQFLGPDDNSDRLWIDFGFGRWLLRATDLEDRVAACEAALAQLGVLGSGASVVIFDPSSPPTTGSASTVYVPAIP